MAEPDRVLVLDFQSTRPRARLIHGDRRPRGEDRRLRTVNVAPVAQRSTVEDVATLPGRAAATAPSKSLLRARCSTRWNLSIAIDVSLGAMAFEEASVARSTMFEVSPGVSLRTCSAEDLIVQDVRSARQGLARRSRNREAATRKAGRRARVERASAAARAHWRLGAREAPPRAPRLSGRTLRRNRRGASPGLSGGRGARGGRRVKRAAGGGRAGGGRRAA